MSGPLPGLPSARREALTAAPDEFARAWSYATEPKGDAAQCPEQRVGNVFPEFVDWSICSVLAVLLAAALICMCLFCYHPRFQNWVISCVQQYKEEEEVLLDDDDDTDLLDLPPSLTLIDCPEIYGSCRSTAQPVAHIRHGRAKRPRSSLNGTKVISLQACEDEVDGSGGGLSSEAIFVMEDVS